MANEPYGYTGAILRVDLTRKKVWVENQNEIFYRRYMGGSNIALYYLLRLIPSIANTDACDPHNVLVFSTSVVTGAPFPGNARYTVAAKSPLTGGYGDSEAGGFWGPELKSAGFDAIVIEGCASKPVYLWIHDNQCEIRNAQQLWGKITGNTEDRIKEELREAKARVACIGPAGENLVRYASIHSDIVHINGRTGMGAVMGSKRLKAIAVRGTQKISLYDENKVRERARWFTKHFKDNPSLASLYELGTPGAVEGLNCMGLLPTRNFQEGVFEGADKIGGQKMREIVTGQEGCFACPVRCKKKVEMERGLYPVDPKYGAPEYETLAAFGSNCGVDDLAIIVKANELCNKYGVDTISTGCAVAFAMECYEKGLIDIDQTGGVELRFGNGESVIRIIEDIVRRRNLGDLLAEGVRRASEEIGKGAEEFAIHVKGEEVPMQEPRGKLGVGIGYAVGSKGADHIEVPQDHQFVSKDSEPLKKLSPLGILEPVDTLDVSLRKVRLFVYLQQLRGIYSVLDICIFVGPTAAAFSLDDFVELVRGATGWDTSLFELMKAAERWLSLARIFNVKAGFTAKDDSLPARFFTPLRKGPYEGKKVPKNEFERLVSSYYRMMGWDEQGIPSKRKLAELDIDWVS